ncbi:MAG: SdpI family protein [Anaerolineae bacterium]|uniref:SdpI family protein n=1 Tax=Promineifilum sp. TaxID=2664178 RepID=UPI0024119C00|nr:SdpI family protein [Promineifilum sp.]MCO5181629.1 SdpI family protein [Promineifilum sp.]MCW5847544.1 SdpI family protein [Anaerolineae bacterium]
MTRLLIMYVVFGLLLVALSIPMLLDKVPPNPWYGFRVPSTLSDEKLWYKANRYIARGLLATGIITVVGALALYLLMPGLPVDTYAWLVLAVFGAPMIVTVVAGFRYLRRLKP